MDIHTFLSYPSPPTARAIKTEREKKADATQLIKSAGGFRTDFILLKITFLRHSIESNIRS